MGELYDLGVRVFTDDGDCVADARRDAPRVRVRGRAARRGARPARRGSRARRAAGTCTRARGRRGSASRAGPPRPRSSIVAARPRARAAHRRPLPRAAPVDAPASVALVRAAKADGRAASPPRRTPHHFALTDAACAGFDPVFKMNPPLRTERRRRRACAPGSLDGTIDAIATDHAPHAPETKERAVRGGAAGHARPRDRARGRAHRARRAGHAHARASARRCCRGSRRAIAGPRRDGHGGPIAAGRPANLCVIDPARDLGRRRRRAWPAESRNTPCDGRKLTGKVRHTSAAASPSSSTARPQR